MNKKVSLQISGMDCATCVINIDGILEDAEGVSEARTSYAKQITDVTFDSKKISQKKIVLLIAQAGYTSQVIST